MIIIIIIIRDCERWNLESHGKRKIKKLYFFVTNLPFELNPPLVRVTIVDFTTCFNNAIQEHQNEYDSDLCVISWDVAS